MIGGNFHSPRFTGVLMPRQPAHGRGGNWRFANHVSAVRTSLTTSSIILPTTSCNKPYTLSPTLTNSRSPPLHTPFHFDSIVVFVLDILSARQPRLFALPSTHPSLLVFRPVPAIRHWLATLRSSRTTGSTRSEDTERALLQRAQ
jgi:hypothetical protein